MQIPVKLHSAYNPQKEAERFSETITGSPKIIIITEPGESYLAPVLRNKFPHAKLIAIRYTDTYFLSSDKLWNSVWRPVHGNLDFFLLNNIPDELLCVTLFLPWKPAEKFWKEAADFVWKTIATSIKMIQSVIATRSFFGVRWLKNITDNFLFAENISNFEFYNEDSFFAASGCSLKTFLKTEKNMLNKKFISAAASAVPALSAYGINPDLCISTDGGFWAASHIKALSSKIPVAFPPEAKIPYNILAKNPCVFLTYGSLIEAYFFTGLNILPKKAKRNGTVSGTAVDLLLDYTKGNIYISGLDLEGSKGFSHAQPHESLKSKENSFFKINPISQFAAVSNFDTRSLEIYAKWFSQMNSERAERIFRIGSEGKTIENIKRISVNDFNSSFKSAQKIPVVHSEKKSKLDRKIVVYEFYKRMGKKINSGFFLNEVDICLKNLNRKSIEIELCELIAFQSYIKLIKNADTENALNAKSELKNGIKDFINMQLKRLKND